MSRVQTVTDELIAKDMYDLRKEKPWWLMVIRALLM